MKTLAVTSLVVGMSMSTAMAADLGRMPVKAPIVVPYYSWTGFYAGIHGGYAFGGSADAFITPGILVPGGAAIITPVTGPFGLSTDPDGWLFGAQVGYNYQMNQWLIGIEADISWADISDSASGPIAGAWRLNNTTTLTGGATLDEKVDYFGTLRARLGLLASDRLLVFATGGLAFGHGKASLSVVRTTSTVPPAGTDGTVFEAVSVSDTSWGYALGAGFEWAFADRWTLGAQYLFINLDTGGALATPSGIGVLNWHGVDLHVIRAALNYRFWTQ
jgi:outer membrane immunogenic protein